MPTYTLLSQVVKLIKPEHTSTKHYRSCKEFEGVSIMALDRITPMEKALVDRSSYRSDHLLSSGAGFVDFYLFSKTVELGVWNFLAH